MVIKPYSKNAKKHPAKQLEQIANSIKSFGCLQPIVISNDGVIIAGHGRYQAMTKILGWTEEREASKALKGEQFIPYILAENLTEEEVKAYRLADNKLNESDWDMDLAIEELKGLDIEMQKLTGFDMDLLIEPSEKDDEVPDVPEEPKSVLGDIYELGNHRLMCGDSTKIEDVEKLMNGQKADMVFTDPPYGIEIVDKKTKKVGAENLAKNQKYSEVIGDDTTDTARDFYNTFVSLGYDKFIIWGGNYFTQFLPFSNSWIVWDKRGEMTSNNFADGEMAWCSFHTRVRIYKQVWNGMIREGEKEKRVHPTQKPVRMLSEILQDFTKVNETVVDVFGGSGSTLIACEQTNRKCYMMELDPHYCDVIVQRYVNYTGNNKIKLNGKDITWQK